MPEVNPDLIKNLMYIPMLIAILGTVLNAQKKIVCFPIWIASNILLVILNLLIGVYAMVGLFVVYTGVSIYGWVSWAKSEKGGNTTVSKNSEPQKVSVAPSKVETSEIPKGCEVGLVKWYNKKKGYGFIVAEKDEREVFFHQSHIEMSGFRILQEGQSVTFSTVAGERGEEGRTIKPL